MHNRTIMTRYLVEQLFAHVLFFTVYFLSVAILRQLPPGGERILISASPVLPAFLMIVVVARHFHRADEYLRQQMLENWALTTAVTFLWTLTYGLLENAGFPRLNLVWICPAMGIVSGFLFFIRGLTIRRQEQSRA
jgi:cobalamin synthase